MITLTEAFRYNAVDRYFCSDFADTGPVGADSLNFFEDDTPCVRRRHNGKHPVAFADGHVEAARYEALYVKRTDAMLSRWDNDHRPHRELLPLLLGSQP